MNQLDDVFLMLRRAKQPKPSWRVSLAQMIVLAAGMIAIVTIWLFA